MEETAKTGGGRNVLLTLLQNSTLQIDGILVERVPGIFFRMSAYLLAGGGKACSRQRLADLFWPEAPAGAASANLRQALVRIRRLQDTHGFRIIETTSDKVLVRPSAQVRCDLTEVEAELAENEPGSALRLSRLYPGDLLTDLGESSSEFEEWLGSRRNELRATVIDRIASALIGDKSLDCSQRSACALHLLAIDPYNEQAYRLLMIAAAAHGQSAQLHDYYARCEKFLMTELGVRPSAETQALFQKLKHEMS